MAAIRRVVKRTAQGIAAFAILGTILLYFNYTSVTSSDQAILSLATAKDRNILNLEAHKLAVKTAKAQMPLVTVSTKSTATNTPLNLTMKSAADREEHMAYRRAASHKYNTTECASYKCRGKVCMEDLTCVGKNLKSRYLPNYKNPCFYEEVIAGENMDQDIMSNLILRRMIKDPLKNPAVIDLQRHWTMRRATKYQLRCLPYFFLIGMEKCGTTDLYKRMGYHPQIELSPAKELQWWTRRRFFAYTNGEFPKEKQDDGYKLGHPEELISVPISHYYAFLDKAAGVIEQSTDKSKPAEFELKVHKDGRLEEEPKLYHSIITGDGSPNIMYWNDFASLFNNITRERGPQEIVAQQIYRAIPQARIIAILRNPVDRLYSSYLFFTPHVSVHDFHQRVEGGIAAFEECCEDQSLRYCVYDPILKERIGSTINIMQGIYSQLVEDWYKTFPAEQIHIIHFETYKGNELETLNKVFNFLGLARVSRNDQVGQRVAQQEPQFTGKRYSMVGSMLPKTRDILTKFYAKYNMQLAVRLNDTAFLWDSALPDPTQ